MTKPGARGILYLCGLVVGTLIVSTGATWAQQNTIGILVYCVLTALLCRLPAGLYPRWVVFVQELVPS